CQAGHLHGVHPQEPSDPAPFGAFSIGTPPKRSKAPPRGRRDHPAASRIFRPRDRHPPTNQHRMLTSPTNVKRTATRQESRRDKGTGRCCPSATNTTSNKVG